MVQILESFHKNGARNVGEPAVDFFQGVGIGEITRVIFYPIGFVIQ